MLLNAYEYAFYPVVDLSIFAVKNLGEFGASRDDFPATAKGATH